MNSILCFPCSLTASRKNSALLIRIYKHRSNKKPHISVNEMRRSNILRNVIEYLADVLCHLIDVSSVNCEWFRRMSCVCGETVVYVAKDQVTLWTKVVFLDILPRLNICLFLLFLFRIYICFRGNVIINGYVNLPIPPENILFFGIFISNEN